MNLFASYLICVSVMLFVEICCLSCEISYFRISKYSHGFLVSFLRGCTTFQGYWRPLEFQCMSDEYKTMLVGNN